MVTKRWQVGRQADTSPAHPQPRFSAEDLGTDSIVHTHALGLQSNQMPQQTLFSPMFLKTTTERALQLILSRFAFPVLDGMSTQVFEIRFLLKKN